MFLLLERLLWSFLKVLVWIGRGNAYEHNNLPSGIWRKKLQWKFLLEEKNIYECFQRRLLIILLKALIMVGSLMSTILDSYNKP